MSTVAQTKSAVLRACALTLWKADGNNDVAAGVVQAIDAAHHGIALPWSHAYAAQMLLNNYPSMDAIIARHLRTMVG